MKKIIVLLVIAICTVSIFAAETTQSSLGQVVPGISVSYVPALKMANIEANVRWRLDYVPEATWTTDLAFQTGIMTDFKGRLCIESFLGAGFTRSIGDFWNFYTNFGLDALLTGKSIDLGVGANAGVECQVMPKLIVGGNLKVVELIQSREILFTPGITVSYSI